MKFKEWIKRIIPTSQKKFHEEMDEISNVLINISCEMKGLLFERGPFYISI